jgi:hypothetical protein
VNHCVTKYEDVLGRGPVPLLTEDDLLETTSLHLLHSLYGLIIILNPFKYALYCWDCTESDARMVSESWIGRKRWWLHLRHFCKSVYQIPGKIHESGTYRLRSKIATNPTIVVNWVCVCVCVYVCMYIYIYILCVYVYMYFFIYNLNQNLHYIS